MSRGKRFTFTLNNYADEDVERLRRLPCHYMVFGRELGDNGTPHIQGYVTFTNARHLSSMRNVLKGCHVDLAAGTSEQCIKYCEKENAWEERGIRPIQENGQRTTKVSKSVISPSWDESAVDVPDSASAMEEQSGTSGGRKTIAEEKRQRLLDILTRNNYDPLSVYKEDKFLYANHYNQIQRICAAEAMQSFDQTPRNWKTKVHVYTGPPGSGKSYHALRRMKGLHEAVYHKDSSPWWEKYRQQPIVFMDEYNDWFAWHDLLRYMSQMPETVQVKNGHAVYNPRHLFITTHRSPYDWYKGCQGFNVRALMDRIDEWITFEKVTGWDNATVKGVEYKRTLQKNYRDDARKFETMDELEELIDDTDERRDVESIAKRIKLESSDEEQDETEHCFNCMKKHCGQPSPRKCIHHHRHDHGAKCMKPNAGYKCSVCGLELVD